MITNLVIPYIKLEKHTRITINILIRRTKKDEKSRRFIWCHSSHGRYNSICFFINNDPLSFTEAIIGEKWIKAMDEEIHVIEKNDTWKLTNISESKKVIGLMIHFLGLEVTHKEKRIFVS